MREREALKPWHCLQDDKGCLLPYATPKYNIHASSHLPPIEEDFALAIRLQEDELEQYSSRHPNSARHPNQEFYDTDDISMPRSTAARPLLQTPFQSPGFVGMSIVSSTRDSSE